MLFRMTFWPARKYTHTHTHKDTPLCLLIGLPVWLCLSTCSSASPSWRRTPCQQWSSAHSHWLAGQRRRARKRATPKLLPSSNQRESPSPGTLMGSLLRSLTKCSSGLMFSVIITENVTPLGLKVSASEISAPTLVSHIMTSLLILVKNSRLMSSVAPKDLCQVEANNHDDITVMSSGIFWVKENLQFRLGVWRSQRLQKKCGGVFSWWQFAASPVEATKSEDEMNVKWY